MKLELERKMLGLPPLGKKDKRTPEQIAQAERETTVPVSEYVNVREGHFQRKIFEVLRESGLPHKTSTVLATVIREIHEEEWNSKENPQTTKALGDATIPITPIEPRNIQADVTHAASTYEDIPFTPAELVKFKKKIIGYQKTGDIISGEVFERARLGRIPRLSVSRVRKMNR